MALMTVSKAEVQEMASKYNRATALAKSVKSAAVARFNPAKRSVIGGLTAFGIGFAEGRLGRDKSTIRRRAVLALAPFEGDQVEAALAEARSDRDWQVRQAAEDLTRLSSE